MAKMKTFLKYVIILILLYVFSNILIDSFFKVSYTKVTNYEIKVEQPFVDVTEAKVSKRNGYINGIVKNNSNKIIENKYLKFSMLSENNNVLGEMYVKIDRLEVNQLKNYEVKFDFDNVKTFRIELTDSKPEDIDFIELIKTNAQDLISTKIK